MEDWIDLVDILEVAQSIFSGAQIHPAKRNDNYKIACSDCGLCEERPKKGVWLYINADKKYFKCFRGQIATGVKNTVKLKCGVDGNTAVKIVNEICGITPENLENRLVHPATKIPGDILKDMGYTRRFKYRKMYERNPEYTLRTLDILYAEYQEYMKRKKRLEKALYEAVRSTPII